MRRYRVKVLLNRPQIDTSRDFADAVAYNLKHGVDIQFDFQNVDIKGYITQLQQITPTRSQYILSGAQGLVQPYVNDLYDAVILCINGFQEFAEKCPSGSTQGFLANGKTVFVNLESDLYDEQSGIFNTEIKHELMHSYKFHAIEDGFPVDDVMDIMIVNGIAQQYYKNADPDALDGNFAQMWKNLEKWVTPLPVILRVGSRGYDVQKLQTILGIKPDGLFGKMTQTAVISFQKLHGLAGDGIVGPKTWDVLNTPQDISKWQLVPELEDKARTFLSACLLQGHKIKIVQGFRSIADQQALYDQGRTKPGQIVTDAKPGQSQHNYGKAFDVCFDGPTAYPTDDKLWKAIADIGVFCGLTPGYYFKSFQDKPHLEIK